MARFLWGVDPVAGRTDIELILSGCRTTRHTVRPDDTLGDLVQLLRRHGHLMGVSDIRVGSSGSLLTSDGWRHMTMKEVGVDLGSTLHISPVRPESVHVVKFLPNRNQPVENQTVSISQAHDVSLEGIESRLRDLSFDPEEASTVTVQNLSFYSRDGRRRRAVESFDSTCADYDEVDGQKADGEKMHLIFNYLSRGSGVIAAPNRIPVLQLLVNAEVLIIDDRGGLRPAYKAALLFPSALLLFRGLRLRDRNGATLAILLRLCGNEYVNVDTGDVFDDTEAAVASASNINGIWSHALILADSSSLLPRYKIPTGKVISVSVRYGWEVFLTQQRVRGQRTERAEMESMWMANVLTEDNEGEFDDMLEGRLTTAMTRSTTA